MVQPRHQLGGDGGGVLRQIATIHAPQRQGQIQEEGSLAPRRWKSAWTALLEVWTPWLPGILAMRSRATSAAPGRGSQACVRSLGSPPRAAVRGRQKGWAMPRRKAPIAPASRGHEDGPPSANPLFITSLEKGLRVLYAFQNLHRALGLTEIAAVTGLSVSAVQRFVHTWQALGYLRKEPGSRRYTLAPRLLDFSCMYQQTSGLVAVAMPHLIALSEQCQETVNLLEPDGTDLLYVARLPRHEIRYPAGVIGARIPAFCTSGGRAILAYLPEAAVRRLLDDACPSLQKPDRDRYGSPCGKCKQHEVRRLDLLKAHKVEVRVIEIGMDVLDRSGRSARDPRDVRLRMAQQDPQRFTAHVATPTDNPHTHHSVLSLVMSYECCLLPAIMLAVRRTPGFRRGWQWERGTSGRCQPSLASLS